ncbi:hypothetical protein [Archangium sp.]|uniref:hypothetical protein n=1 Tax=Archangium sp. TaxID=1872627 RepID=UPI002D627DD6|nr:hypothetical protein [Archangium sp.]HYO59067.1 hypothetical protein [Archangium sp.]
MNKKLTSAALFTLLAACGPLENAPITDEFGAPVIDGPAAVQDEGSGEIGNVEQEACTGCGSYDPQPTLSNGGCNDSAYNCYVYPKYVCDSVRLTNRNTCGEYFNLNPGNWPMWDSSGNLLGYTATSSIRVNTGIRAVDGTATLGRLMAWSVPLTNGTTRTGWLDTNAMAESTTGNYDTQPPNPGGSISLWHVVPSDNTPYLDRTGASLKVNPTCPAGGQNATDYLARNGSMNIIYNLPGTDYGSPTEGVYPNNTNITFYRYYPSVTSVDRDLWDCSSGSPVLSTVKLKFIYGYMHEKHVSRTGVTVIKTRRGWVALPNLAAGAGTRDY